MHNQKLAYQQKVDAELREWEAKAELLKAKGNNLVADAKLEFDKQLQTLQTNKSEFSAYVDQIADKAEDTWDEVKDEAEAKWHKFSNSVSNFVSKYN
jgi:peptidoglycan hydrolase CwlO-like protein